jgi:hypothetical protein
MANDTATIQQDGAGGLHELPRRFPSKNKAIRSLDGGLDTTSGRQKLGQQTNLADRIMKVIVRLVPPRRLA